MIFQPVALTAEHQSHRLAGRHPRRRLGGGLVGRNHRLGLVVVPGRRRDHETAVADGVGQAVVERGALEDPVGAGRHDAGPLVGPALHRFHQAQTGEPEIGHGARAGAYILAKLRLDQHHHRRRLLDPSFGLVGTRTGHTVLLGGQTP